ncbi:MAG: hydrogenase maturation nickel metallochaperone HypA [Candidatus Altiarchaeales archaeon]|nr:MAG: hydrogenase maturation nickel metallochaperone HypA [Candidatus Altiarchaeales archaeon]RLI93630.1 MAG: hydrogenase maturation nickel metallochaperone HypA [Candidatus Altiarchaeales archaeon]HDO82092.1 hydrogenase maturation nickel metallochaperone HypA [Candidatus Altiarchaeales archaeon]HEX54741.1 hydrogenase maturation nickel metallochaperone HypA [Candidatus Altiarchaeales archaeon]
MHEFSIAVNILENAIKEAKKHKANRVKEIFLEIGQLTLINPEQLEFAIKSIAEGTIAENLRVNIEISPIRVKCGNEHVNELQCDGKDYYFLLSHLRCPECGEAVKILSGRECILKRIIAD